MRVCNDSHFPEVSGNERIEIPINFPGERVNNLNFKGGHNSTGKRDVLNTPV
jgi:hypothetical protein